MRWTLLASALTGALAACTGFSPPTPEALARLPHTSPASTRPFRATAVVTIESDGLRGTFDALLVAEPLVPRVRLQLLPDIGGKVLDLTATPARFFGTLADQSIDCAPEDAPRSVLAFMAFTLLEMFHPVTPARVRGQRGQGEAGGVELDVTPVAGDLDVHYRPETGQRRFTYRHVHWTQSGNRVAGRGFLLRIDAVEWEPAQLSPAVFGP